MVSRAAGFLLGCIAAGPALAGPASAAAARAPARVVTRCVVVPTADGSADASLILPASPGKWPAVLLWPDIAGLRGLYGDIGRRIAAAGYVVLVPNSFYRTMKPSTAAVDASDPAIRAGLARHRAAATDAAIARDAQAYFAYMDRLAETDRGRAGAAIGYDLGGAHAFLTAAALPARIAAVGSIYGVSVAAARPTSPHLLVPRTRAEYYVAIARDHDAREPGDRKDIVDIIRQAGLKGRVEVYPADQGWADPDGGRFDPAAAERSMRALLDLLDRGLRRP